MEWRNTWAIKNMEKIQQLNTHDSINCSIALPKPETYSQTNPSLYEFS